MSDDKISLGKSEIVNSGYYRRDENPQWDPSIQCDWTCEGPPRSFEQERTLKVWEERRVKMAEEQQAVAEDADKAVQNKLIHFGDIFDQLIGFDRFQTFLACNYELKTVTDDETNEVRTVAIELDHDEVEERLNGLLKAPKGEPDIKLPTPEEIAKIIG